MSTVTLPRIHLKRRTQSNTATTTNPFIHLLQRTLLHIAVIIICAIWIIPTLALLISSFRPANLVATTGWWTALTPPFQFTLDLYQQALGRSGMAQSFVNSLFISIPATIIPIM